MWSSVGFNTFTDTYGARIQNRDGDSLITRIGLSANYAGNRKSADGLTISSTFYGIANLYQEFIGGQKITYSGTNLETENDRTWGGIGAGGTYAWADEKYTLYGEGSVNTSLTNFADSYTLKGTIGFKMKW